MQNDAVIQLRAARRYLTGVLLHLSVDAENMTAYRLIELLEYFSENPAEYLAFTNAKDE